MGEYNFMKSMECQSWFWPNTKRATMNRAPQSRERREHCSRTNSILMDNFSQNHVYSAKFCTEIVQKSIYKWKKVFCDRHRMAETVTDCPWQTQTVHDRHCIDVLLIYSVLSQKYYALSRTIFSQKNGAHGQKIFCGSLAIRRVNRHITFSFQCRL